MLDMVMAILHSNSEVMNAQPKGFVHVFTDDELRTAGKEILLLIQQFKKETQPQLKQANVSGLLPDKCKHEKIYYCLKTGGGRCRKCKKLVGQ